MALKGLLADEYYDNVSADQDDVDMTEPSVPEPKSTATVAKDEDTIDNDNQGNDMIVDNDGDDASIDINAEDKVDELSRNKINKILSAIPSKMKDCTKSNFCLILLLIVEIKNAQTDKDKIDYLLLYNFIKTTKQFDTVANILKLTKDEFIKIFADKTDFDTTKISQICDTFSSDDSIKNIINAFKANVQSKKINIEQTMSKIIKCELIPNTTSDTEGDDEKTDDKQAKDEKWKKFHVGQKLDVRDKWNQWYLAEIQKHKTASDNISAEELGKENKENLEFVQNLEAIYIHYIGFAEKYDEWIIITDDKIFCDSKQISEEKEHRLAPASTQSEYKKKNKKKKKKKVEEEEEIEKN